MDGQDKSAGKAQSYAKKYGLMMALQMFTADGDETRPDGEYAKQAPAPPPVNAMRPTPVSQATLDQMNDLLRSAPPEMKEKIKAFLEVGKIAGMPEHNKVIKTIRRLEGLQASGEPA